MKIIIVQMQTSDNLDDPHFVGAYATLEDARFQAKHLVNCSDFVLVEPNSLDEPLNKARELWAELEYHDQSTFEDGTVYIHETELQ